MSSAPAGPEIARLMKLLARLPGLGPRSARRAVLELVRQREQLLLPLHAALGEVAAKVCTCTTCGNIDVSDPCRICAAPGRDDSVICVVEEVGDLWALERAAAFRGRYHVLGGHLSALDGIGPDDLNLASLARRAAAHETEEVILAMNATIDGQTTAHYIMDILEDKNVKISRLAHGVPVGGELDYLDEGTLSAAMAARRPFQGL
ncbi:MAG TPA: recombination protein RecR [Hellea balneolensis]|uniref:Recombination protein RecR n=1 Tax=Hellea balneolensis TaxID=287478 RepID=A0A7V5NWC9_9PROT|nr:recombination protein RecR [Hellea balneolensis]